jgi:hypothetical protein
VAAEERSSDIPGSLLTHVTLGAMLMAVTAPTEDEKERAVGLAAELADNLTREQLADVEQAAEDRLTAYTVRTHARIAQENVIQRMPSPGDRWRSLSDEEIQAVASALLFFVDSVRENKRATDAQRDSLDALQADAWQEVERRGLMPE